MRLDRAAGRVVATVALLAAMLVSNGDAGAWYARPGTTQRVNLSIGGGESGTGASGVDCATSPTSCSTDPAISGNGRYVAFGSLASDLVSGDRNAAGDIFARDLKTGRTRLVSVASDGTQAVYLPTDRGTPTYVAISHDGRLVAFDSTAINLVGAGKDTNLVRDLFVHDLRTGETVRVNVSSAGAESNGSFIQNLGFFSLSANGRYVAFQSDASNLVAGDTNECGVGPSCSDVFVRDLRKNKTERVSLSYERDAEPNGASFGGVSISHSGRYVVFGSDATNLVPGDTNRQRDVFVFDRLRRTTTRISVNPDGSEVAPLGGNSSAVGSTGPSFSRDGHLVLFKSNARSLVPTDGFASCDFFVRNMRTARTERVSIASDGTERDGGCGPYAAMTPNGRFVVFDFSAPFAPDDENACDSFIVPSGDIDPYVYDRLTGATELASRSTRGVPAGAGRRPDYCQNSNAASISSNGRLVAFASTATNLVPRDTNGLRDIFVRDRGLPLSSGWGTGEPSEPSEPPVCLPVVGCFGLPRVAAATDRTAGPVSLRHSPADLLRVKVVYRPESGDLFVALDVARLDTATAAAEAALVYGFSFGVDHTRYEVRVQKLPDATTGRFGLFECPGSICEPVGTVAGGYGTTGSRIVFAVPLGSIGLSKGGRVSSLDAYSGRGSIATGAVQILDRVRVR